jgi:hypothetical protein
MHTPRHYNTQKLQIPPANFADEMIALHFRGKDDEDAPEAKLIENNPPNGVAGTWGIGFCATQVMEYQKNFLKRVHEIHSIVADQSSGAADKVKVATSEIQADIKKALS